VIEPGDAGEHSVEASSNKDRNSKQPLVSGGKNGHHPQGLTFCSVRMGSDIDFRHRLDGGGSARVTEF
jgi:hypothetical protein